MILWIFLLKHFHSLWFLIQDASSFCHEIELTIKDCFLIGLLLCLPVLRGNKEKSIYLFSLLSRSYIVNFVSSIIFFQLHFVAGLIFIAVNCLCQSTFVSRREGRGACQWPPLPLYAVLFHSKRCSKVSWQNV